MSLDPFGRKSRLLVPVSYPLLAPSDYKPSTETLNGVYRAIAKSECIPIERLGLDQDSNPADKFNWDSLETVQVALDMEDEFDVSIPDEDVPRVLSPLASIRDICHYLDEKKKRGHK